LNESSLSEEWPFLRAIGMISTTRCESMCSSNWWSSTLVSVDGSYWQLALKCLKTQQFRFLLFFFSPFVNRIQWSVFT
jgi:hypothetical protein